MQRTVAYCGIENSFPWDTKSFSRVLKVFDLDRVIADDEKWVGAAELISKWHNENKTNKCI